METIKIDLLSQESEINESLDISKYIVNPKIKIEPPIPILSIYQNGFHNPFFTEDNISMIQGKAKSRKSTLIKAIGISILSGKYNFLQSNYERNNIAIIDTEQGKYHCWQSANIIYQKSGVDFSYYRVSELAPAQKKKLVEEHLRNNPNCGFLILDNIVHFLTNFNDATESSELNQWLIKTKSEFNCHICLVLHENGSDYGNGKAKGHIGTLLENTCETIIRVEKDKDDKSRSIVSVKESRGLGFDEFLIERDMQGVPYISEYFKEIKTINKL